ncbi:MAG: O-antigen ligase family protein [Vicinamibacterales bacterium]
MPPELALFFGAVFVFAAFRSDPETSRWRSDGLFSPTLWYVAVASRPIGVWLAIWGVPLLGGGGDAADGSVIDQFFYSILTVIGLSTLLRRRVNFVATIRSNPVLTLMVLYMAVSIVWSHYPFVSFKRLIKMIGSIVMALVIVTHPRRLEATLTVLKRCLFIHLPMSIVCTRYFRDIGVTFDWIGSTESWVGISTSKNTLGQVAMLGLICFTAVLRQNWSTRRFQFFPLAYLGMALYLLRGSSETVSMTSVSVAAFSVIVLCSLQAYRRLPPRARPFVITVFGSVLGLVLLISVHSVVMFSEDSILGTMVTMIGRDITLTDRTYIWSDCYAAVSNPLLGVGYGGFWIGRMANIPWNAQMTWVLGQAHSGYVETYLQLGLIGVALLSGVVFTSLPELLRELETQFDQGAIRITLFLTTLFVNITESVFPRGDHHLWLVFLLTVIHLPVPNLMPRKHLPRVPLQRARPVATVLPKPASGGGLARAVGLRGDR